MVWQVARPSPVILVKGMDLLPRKVHKHNCSICFLSENCWPSTKLYEQYSIFQPQYTTPPEVYNWSNLVHRYTTSRIVNWTSEIPSCMCLNDIWKLSVIIFHQVQREVEKARLQRIKDNTGKHEGKQREILSSTSLFQSFEKYDCTKNFVRYPSTQVRMTTKKNSLTKAHMDIQTHIHIHFLYFRLFTNPLNLTNIL